MKVKFLKNGMGYGFSYFKGDIGVIHDENKAKELVKLKVVVTLKRERR